MSLLISLWLIIFGLGLLTLGGNLLVDGAVSIAKRYRISEAVIGLTIVAIGTSVPELAVSVIAGLRGSTEIAIGNVIGSNIANIYLVLGLTALVVPVTLSRSTRFFDLPMVMFATLILLVFVSDAFLDGGLNRISRIDGITLITFAVVYIAYSLRHNNFVADEADAVGVVRSPLQSILSVAWGIVVLFFWWKILVDGAVSLALGAGVSESMVGLTIVAVGTSAPELVTSLISARRGNPGIAIGNVVGSCIMNIFVILGVTAVIAPIPFLDGSYLDLAIALLAPMIVLILALLGKQSRYQLQRTDGLVLLAIYVGYILYLVVREMV